MYPFSSVSTAPKQSFSVGQHSDASLFETINSQLAEITHLAKNGYDNNAREICLAIIKDTVQLQKTGNYANEVRQIYAQLHKITLSYPLTGIDNELKDCALEFELDADFDNAKVIYEVIVDNPSKDGPDAEAQNRLDWLNNPESFDPEQELEHMRNACGNNRKVAAYYFGKMHQAGAYGVKEDLVKAAYWFNFSDQQGYSPAKNLLNVVLSCMSGYQIGAWHESYVDSTTHLTDAWNFYEKAAAKNDPNALCRIGHAYQHGEFGLSKDESKAIDYYTKAVAQKDPQAARLLGDIYKEKGQSSSFWNDNVSMEKAISLYKDAALWSGTKKDWLNYVNYLTYTVNRGISSAMCALGQIYIDGNLAKFGIRKNVEQGKNLIAKAVQDGHVDACYAYANYCEKGIITPEHASNVRREFFCYSEAIEGNAANTKFVYFETPLYKQLAKAIELYLYAAEHGHEDAYPSMISLQLQLVETMHAGKKKTIMKEVEHPISHDQHLNNLCRFGEIVMTSKDPILSDQRDLGEHHLRVAANQGHQKAAWLLAGVLENRYNEELNSFTGELFANKYRKEQIHYLEIVAEGEGDIANDARKKLVELTSINETSITSQNSKSIRQHSHFDDL